MKRILAAALLATSTLAVAGPVLAQTYGGPPPSQSYDRGDDHGDRSSGYGDHRDGDRDHHDGDRGPGYGDRHDGDGDRHDGDRGRDYGDRGRGSGVRTGGDYWAGSPFTPRERADWMRNRIREGIAEGRIDRRQAYYASRELDQVRQLAYRFYQRDGGRISPQHAVYINQRLDHVRDTIRFVEQRTDYRR